MVVNWTAAATPTTKITLGQESVLNSETASQQALSINPKIVRTSISSPLHGVMTLSPRIEGPGAEDVSLITCMPYLNGPPSNVFEVFASGDVVCTSINAGGPDSTMSIFSKIAINQEGMNEQVQVPGTRVVPPVRNNDPGRRGMYAVDNNWLYIAVADNQWKRIALQTW
jgi:hypothetical protein